MEPPSFNREDGESLRDEAALVARATKGDRAAWRVLYLRHKDFVYRVALRFLGDEAEARDVSQDVFVQVFATASRYRPAGKFTTYLWRVTANRCLNERARAHHRLRADADEPAANAEPDEAGTPEDRLARAQTDAAVRAAIAALPERQRLAVILSRFEGLSYAEIASALETSVPSVESLLFRARQRLARALAGT